MSEIDAKKIPTAGPTATTTTNPLPTDGHPEQEDISDAKMALDSEEIGKYYYQKRNV